METKIAADVAQYRSIYAALDTISTKSNQFEWQGVLLPLKEGDICGLDQYNESTSEGHCNLSWIWKTNLQGGDEGLQEGKQIVVLFLQNLTIYPFTALRIEWCKSRARAQCWQEECELLTEEMRRVRVTFACYAQLWTTRTMLKDLPGAKAYAFRQAALWNNLCEKAEAKWLELQASFTLTSTEIAISSTDLDNRTTGDAVFNEV